MESETLVRCDACGCAFAPAVVFIMNGEIQRFIMTCPYCGKRYLAAVTDKELRDRISFYSKMAAAHKGTVMSDAEAEVMQQMKRECVKRCEELKELYPLEEEQNG